MSKSHVAIAKLLDNSEMLMAVAHNIKLDSQLKIASAERRVQEQNAKIDEALQKEQLRNKSFLEQEW